MLLKIRIDICTFSLKKIGAQTQIHQISHVDFIISTLIYYIYQFSNSPGWFLLCIGLREYPKAVISNGSLDSNKVMLTQQQ